MRTIIRGIVALFAAFCMMDAAQAAPTIVSPADYSTVQTLTDSMKNLISPLNLNVSIFSSKNTTERENYETEYFYNNSVPATLSWSGTTGDCTVKVWRTNGGSESAPFFSETVSGTSTECYNLEVGCNYTWKVTDSQGNSAVGHFFTEDQAPRIIRGRRSNFIYSSGADCSNGRDIGGWATADGKRVKQGKIYRSGQLEYCSFKEGSGIYQKMDMLYDVLGIRVDVDLRTVNNVNAFADWTAEWDTGSDNVCKWSGIGPDVERFTIEWETLGKGPSEGNPYVYDGKYGCQFPSYSGFYNSMSIDYKVGDTTKTYTQTAAQNKIAVWAAFNRIYQAVVVDKEPVIFHCSHGKDRTGSLALVIHGLLGVSEANIKRDFATAWFCNPDYTFTQTSMNNMITGLKNLDTASTKTLAGGCEEYLISCATAAGDNAGATKVAAFKTAMLEEPETAAAAPLDDIGTAEEGDWGYRKTIGNEVAIVFTNHTKTVTWTVPENLENVQFLVVGGGGGGGEDSDDGNTHGGAGGGGGGVVTGLVDFAENSVVTITVGAGGNGGVRATQGGTNNKYGAAFSGEASSINVDGAEYVWAAGGGGDNGADVSTNASKTKGNVGNDGGSSAGSRPGQTGRGAVIAPRVASVSDIKYADTSFGRQGGAGYYVTSADGSNTFYGYFSAAGGGGGATQDGGSAVDYTNAGNGGEGLMSSITGQAVVYGSGGGGATLNGTNGGKGGTGAGDGNTADVANGTASMDALPNQGGGGGGGARAIKTNSSGVGVGGNGGSGIVVLRYTTASVDPEEPVLTAVVAPTAVANLVYTGSELTGVVASDGYTLADNTATDAGTYEATATLADGYKWSDDTTEPKTISWSIAKATNEWTTEPSISLTEWTQGEEAGVLTAGVAKFGEVTSSMTELPTEVGSYTITYTVAENNNYNGLTKTISFEIKAAVVVEPDPEEPGTGGEDPSEKPKLAIDAKFGYVLTGLGELGDQAIVVFTNSAEAANWQVPRTLKNVEILAVGGGGGGGGHYYSSTAKNCQGGAGGGGGAVVTGFIKDLVADQVVNVTVGAGGAGGAATTSATTGAGKGGNGGNTVLKVGDVTYVTAYGGGGDGGYNSAGVANGGSNSGVRGTKTAANLKSVTVVGEGAENLVTDIVARANKGGGGYSTSSGYPGAGGGGAGSVGYAAPGSSYGGACGYGYVSMITDARVVYGAGGGGGIGKNGGTGTYLEEEFMPFIEGAGLGVAGKAGGVGLANQGAGGGGGSYKCAGGAGGSGIVVLRFAYFDGDIPVDATANILPKISDKVYTGEALVSGLENTYAYTVEELGERISFGQQTVRVTLNDGYVWADGDTNKSKDFTWNITQEANNWKVEPYLSHTAWPQVFASTVNFKFTAPETSFGVLQAELSANGAAPQSFSGTLPTEPGSYTLRYWVEGNDNWAAKEWTVNFKIYRSEAFAEGYKVYGLGENGDEVAVVFTQNASWTVPANLKSAQFLVVGGGGGGGADSHYDAAAGGAGGGGGGVVTGEVDLIKDATVAVTIGAGGAGGQLSTDQKDGASSGSYYGGSKKGGNTVLKVDGATYVTAYGGGRDQGVTKKDTSSITTADMSEGGQGGSNGGSRGGFTADQSKNPTMGAVASNAALRNCTTYGNKGGKGCSESFWGYPSAGGGGGATEAGGDAGNDAAGWPGGKGGEGLASDITGARLVYGSGGGGASTQGSLGGIGGSGAGNGGDREDAQGTSALANQGGGGGGSSRETTYGGAGGSGIVVLRYTVATEPVLTAVDVPAAVADLVYTGSELTGVVAADGYTLTDNTATDAGTYEATATLAEGYKWSDDTTEPKTISWSIAKATNEWTTEPSISLATWTQGETAGVLTAGVAKFGEVTSSMAEFPTAVGKYTITYTVVETDNYSGLTKEVSFEILKKAASYDFTVGDVALTDDKLTFKGNFAIDGESEVAKMNLVVSVYDVAEGGDALKTVTVEDISAGEFNQEIDIASLELADGVYYFVFEVQDEAGNVLVAAEERSRLVVGELVASKPTVNYASGTKFTAIGVEQKPVVTPADGNGYTVSYEGDFTAAGTHRVVIALKDGWTWSDGTSDTLTYEYEFIERTYTKYYIKTFKASGTDQGTFQSDSRWFTDSEFAASSKISTCPNVYDAHNIPNIPANVQLTLLIDNDAGKVLTPKFGKFTVNGNFRIRTYSGGLMFQNDTATPMPIWEVESGVSTIEGVVIDVNGSGTGYIDIGANTTNVLGGVNYNVNYDNGFESSKKLFVRFSDEATAGSALRVQDFEAFYATNFGWFEGGAEGSTYALDIEEGVLNLNNPDAVSGVAGDLAITVKLGDKVGAADAYLNVAGTLNINEGTTLAVDANAMPCGVYTIINAATFNGADLLTSAAGATVTGLAEFTSGELVREGNKIVLYIETTIPPRVPGIEGASVATNAVFDTARVAKPIWYKTKPAINGDEITFNRVTVKVPEYYDVTLETLADGYLVNLKLKDNLKAFIANKVENDQIVTPAIRIENEKVYIHLENTKSDLYYTLLKSTKLGADADWQPTEDYAIGKADFEYTPAEGEAETCFFMAGDVMDEPPESK